MARVTQNAKHAAFEGFMQEAVSSEINMIRNEKRPAYGDPNRDQCFYRTVDPIRGQCVVGTIHTPAIESV